MWGLFNHHDWDLISFFQFWNQNSILAEAETPNMIKYRDRE